MIFWGKDSEWFWAFVQCLIVTGSLAFVIQQIRLQRFAHLLAGLNVLETNWYSDQMLESRARACREPGPKQALSEADIFVCNFFEHLGSYVHQKSLPKELVFETYAFAILNYWVIMKDGIRESLNK